MVEIKVTKLDDFNFDIAGDSLVDLEFIYSQSDVFVQRLQLLINTYANDWIYNLQEGVDYMFIFQTTNIFSYQIEQAYRDKISLLTGFKSMYNFTIEQLPEGELKVSFTVESIYEDVEPNMFTQTINKNKIKRAFIE